MLSVVACGDTTEPESVASVVLTPSTATLVSLGETVQLSASAQDANGNAISGKTFTWSSSDASIATVSASGLVTAVANGPATIGATTDGVNGTAAVTVDASACGEATSTSTVGTYTLRTVKDSTLATIAIQVGNDTLWVQHGNIELKDDDTYSLLVHFRWVEAGSYKAAPQTEVGAYAATGTTIRFSGRQILVSPAVSTGAPIGRDGGDLTGSLTGITLAVIAPIQAFGLAAEAEFVFCK